jgi:preprotein translocase subunit SecG
MTFLGLLLVLLHLVVSIGLVVIVLLQAGKGAGLGGVFGGGGGGEDALFGGGGPGSGIRKLTIAFGAIFVITSLSLAYVSSHRTTSLMDSVDMGTSVTEDATDEAADEAAAAEEAASDEAPEGETAPTAEEN